jgi:hypothetical protein
MMKRFVPVRFVLIPMACVVCAWSSFGADAGAEALPADLRAGIEKALPRVNQCMPDSPGMTLIPLGFIELDRQGDNQPEWQECLVAMPNVEAEPGLDNRVMRDILNQVQGVNGVLIFFERGGRIHLYARDRSGVERYFSAPHPPAKSKLKPEDFQPESRQELRGN